jgi:hypothetical protein
VFSCIVALLLIFFLIVLVYLVLSAVLQSQTEIYSMCKITYVNISSVRVSVEAKG